MWANKMKYVIPVDIFPRIKFVTTKNIVDSLVKFRYPANLYFSDDLQLLSSHVFLNAANVFFA